MNEANTSVAIDLPFAYGDLTPCTRTNAHNGIIQRAFIYDHDTRKAELRFKIPKSVIADLNDIHEERLANGREAKIRCFQHRGNRPRKEL